MSETFLGYLFHPYNFTLSFQKQEEVTAVKEAAVKVMHN